MAKPQGKCIFCNGSGLTKEHILPKWMRPLLVQYGEHTENYSIRTEITQIPLTDITTIKPTLLSRQGIFVNRRLRVVCKDCNSGWMSAMEAKAKPLLSELITGQPCSFGAHDQNTIATWAAMRAAVFERDHPESASISTAEYRHMHQTREPPENWRVFLAAHTSEEWRVRLLHYPFTAYRMGQIKPHKLNSQKTLIGIGSALIMVVSSTAAAAARTVDTLSPPNMVQIWPSIRDVVWPISPALDTEQVGALSYGTKTTG